MLSSALSDAQGKRRSSTIAVNANPTITKLEFQQAAEAFSGLPDQWISDSKCGASSTTARKDTTATAMQQDADKLTAEFVNKVKYQLKDRPALFKRFITYISQARAKETSNDKMLAHTEKMLAAYPQSVAAFRRFLNDMQAIYFGHVGMNQYAQKVSTIDMARREAWNKLLDKVANHFAGQQEQYREFCERLLGYGSNVKAIEARCKPCFEGAPHLFQELSQLLRKDIQWLHLLNPATSFARKLAQHFGSNSTQFLELITAMSSGDGVGSPDSPTRVQSLLKDRPDLYNEYMNAINSPNFFHRQVPERSESTSSSAAAANSKTKSASAKPTNVPLSREQLLLLHEMHTAFLQDARSKDPSGKSPLSAGHKATMRQFCEVMQIEADLQVQASHAKKQVSAKLQQQQQSKYPQPDPSLSPLSATLKLAEEAAKNDKLPLPRFPAFASDIHDSRAKCGAMANRHALLQQFQRLVRQEFSHANGPNARLASMATQADPVVEPTGKRHCPRPASTVTVPTKQPSILFTLPPSAWRSPASLLYASTRTFGSPIQPPLLKTQSLRVPLRELAGRGYCNLEMNLKALFATDGEVDSAMRWIRERQAAPAPTPQSESTEATTATTEKEADRRVIAVEASEVVAATETSRPRTASSNDGKSTVNGDVGSSNVGLGA
ncbi:hypothetical protein BCR44DRAFT_42094 [Catenaria anguillulae PL171]|uniref:Uncharacterized protein n=1 Tax=Catenaria anguillulae PL171 TaxID=765915 RepID=A0A1Y2H9G6_9FUNG|nr:hypothetical protein BCR44DRAFT_42094 [Catenaria anguillulae PL171]